MAAAKDANARLGATERRSGPTTTTTTPTPAGLSAGQAKILREKLKEGGRSPDDFVTHFGCDLDQLPGARFKEAVAWCKAAS